MGSYKKNKHRPSPLPESSNSNKDEMGSYNYKMFNLFNRKFKITEAEPPKDVKKVFSKFSNGGSHMTADQLRRFLVLHQDELDCTLADAQRIVEEVINRRHHLTRYSRYSLNLDDFFHFLLYDDLNGPITSQVHNDMTAPLAQYFIYTGHNSYLTGNQLSSDCSEVPIVKALQRGVRVIELDLWPGSAKDEILVLHGRTLTTPVPLIKCLKSIREYAFASSPYPVIITLEDHLTPELQAKVAEMVTQTFGGMLYYPESDSLLQFPSPESLKHRIIISTKPPKEYLESSGIKRKGPLSPGGRNSSEEDDEASGIPDHTAELEADDRSDSDQDDEDLTDWDNKSGQLGAPVYKRLITIHAGKPKGCLKDALKATADKVRRLSLSEQELEKAAATNGTDVVRFTQNNILRIYPKGTRITSSNYKPLVGWMHGAQMIAFNMQGYGKSLWLMHGMFRANGGCGYLKKPDFLMEKGPNNEVFDPKRKLPVTKTLKVKVYLGDGWRLDFSHTHFDSYSPPDFYTKVYIVGVPADAAKRKTKIIEDNWSPSWNEEFTFPLTVPELALLRVEVQEYDMSDKDDFGGQTCLPVLDLRPGIRSVPLHDKKGEKLKNSVTSHAYNLANGEYWIPVTATTPRPTVQEKQKTFRVCFCFRRRFRLAEAEAPDEIKALFNQYSENGVMTTDHLQRFLIEVQKQEKDTFQEAQSIVESFKHMTHFYRKGLHLEAFFKYLFGDTNPPLDLKLGVHHDMTAPLSHYFIYTGHNSYLTGNQLSSDCSDVPIINALKKGVRVIELDIWPNSDNDDVEVLHGRTLTTPVQLIKCLRSIKEHAFTASEYPVVITLEDHLNTDLQAKVAQMVTQTFGDILFSPGAKSMKELPSPESLKRRIIISTKPPKEYLEAKEIKDKERDTQKGDAASDEEAWGKEIPILKGHFHADDKNELDKDDDDDDDAEEDLDEGHHKLQQDIAPEYKRLIAIRAGKPKGGLEECLRVDPDKVRRLSLSEPQLEKAAETHGKEIVRFTQRNILRVYPKGTRVNSSNYNPLVGWMHGAQMVAFNMQGYGRSLWLMQGMFRANGGCGFVKKPSFLLKSGPHGEVFDTKAKLPPQKTLKVKIYMGEGWYYDFHHTHFDAYSPPDFYVRVGVAGVPADTVMKKTKTLEDSWIPFWNEEFEFPLTVPELALLRIEVHEYDMSEKDDFGGQTCLPIWELRQGIRAVPLHDRKGERYSSVKLLVRLEFV
uniref:Phosphoinositide phospholipase C n=1 Tax=Salix viminalis TaxID=40686 RepID=A0A6N2LTP6_SALVM